MVVKIFESYWLGISEVNWKFQKQMLILEEFSLKCFPLMLSVHLQFYTAFYAAINFQSSNIFSRNKLLSQFQKSFPLSDLGKSVLHLQFLEHLLFFSSFILIDIKKNSVEISVGNLLNSSRQIVKRYLLLQNIKIFHFKLSRWI